MKHRKPRQRRLALDYATPVNPVAYSTGRERFAAMRRELERKNPVAIDQ